MKCGRCGINDATILIRQVINGKESEFSLCENCAKEIGFSIQSGLSLNGYSGSLLAGNIFSALSQLGNASQVNTGVFVPGKSGSGVCENCKMTLAEFREKGRLGCSHCYEAFDDQLTQVFRRIQSGEIHRGRKLAEAPESIEIREIQDKIGQCKKLIQKAVEIEDYESAAQYKAEIVRLTQEAEKLKTEQETGGKPAEKAKKGFRKPHPPKGGESGNSQEGGAAL